MGKRLFTVGACFTVVLSLAVPTEIVAERNICSADGATIVYINGIFTEKTKAQSDMDLLYKKFNDRNPGLLLYDDFRLGYNQTHLAGLGDLIKSILEKVWEQEGQTKEDFDLLTIVKQLQSEVKTQKILIIGHSQGAFYANALYEYLVRRGVPAKSLAVYTIATPASYVSGHGKYLTNENDRVIQSVREAARAGNLPEPLPPNTSIDPMPGDENDEWAGHSISDVYLQAKPTDIASTMAFLLGRLESDPTRDSGQPCIPSPDGVVSYLAKQIAFGVADPLASGAKPVLALADRIGTGITDPVFALGGRLAELFSKTFAARPEAQQASAAAAFDALPQDEIKAEVTSDPAVQQALIAPPIDQPKSRHSDPVSPEPSTPTPPTSPSPIPATPPVNPQPPLALGFAAGDGAWGGGGAGGGGSSASSASDSSSASTPAPTPAASLTVAAPANNFNTNNTTISASGTADASATITLTVGTTSATTTADGSGAWSLSTTLAEGSYTLSFSAVNTSGVSSATITRTVVVDLTPPDTPTLSISECSYSLASGVCFIPETTVTAQASATDASTYEIHTGAALASSGSASQSVALTDNTTSSVTAIAIDAAGNRSATSSAMSVVVMSQPVIINEVAWAGTTANSEDEWIELKNLSSYDIDMSKLSLEAADGAPSIALTGTLSAANPDNNNDLYLIERSTSATTLSDDRHTFFDLLADTGEELHLYHGTGTATTSVDQTPAVATCGGWCAGSALTTVRFSEGYGTVSATVSMERKSGTTNGALSSSWQGNDGYTKSGSDASGNDIYGTPKRESSSGLPAAGWYCAPDTSTIASGARYTPTGSSCTYLSGFLNPLADRYGTVFKGTAGNAQNQLGHYLGKNDQKDGTGTPSGSQNDSFFTAVFEARAGSSDLADFMNWFAYGTTTSGSTAPPHSAYRIINWTYGP